MERRGAMGTTIIMPAEGGGVSPSSDAADALISLRQKELFPSKSIAFRQSAPVTYRDALNKIMFDVCHEELYIKYH